MRTSPKVGSSLLCSLGILFSSGCGYFINPNAVIPSGPGTPSQSGSITISPTYVALSPGQKFQFTATAAGGGTLEWLVNNVGGGAPATGQIDSAGNYTAPAVITQSENISVTAALASSPAQNYATAIAAIVPGGLGPAPTRLEPRWSPPTP